MEVLLISKNLIFSGTFLEELSIVLNTGKFTEIIDEPASNEKVIGEMDDLEKALNTLCLRYEKIAAEFLRQDSIDKDLISQEAKFMKIKGRFKIAHAWLWSNIEERFADQLKAKVSGHGIRSNFRVVQTFGFPPKSQYSNRLLR